MLPRQHIYVYVLPKYLASSTSCDARYRKDIILSWVWDVLLNRLLESHTLYYYFAFHGDEDSIDSTIKRSETCFLEYELHSD